MLSVSHAATGALIAAKLPHPLLYIPLALAANYLQDWIPHWDFGTGLSNGTRTRRTAFLLEIVDMIATIGLVYWLWQHGQSALQTHIWLGAFVALGPDFLEAPRNFLKSEPAFLKPLNAFHHKFHHSTPKVLLGLAPQVVLLGVIWFLR